jgi:hypothetical protein
MISLENRLASTVLGAIRSRRQPLNVATPRVLAAACPARLREASFSDFDGVMALRRTVGWSDDTVEEWDRLWRYNPALTRLSTVPPMGWVLEAQGKVVGYLGNIPSCYRYGNRDLTAVTGTGLVVENAYRAAALSLNAAFYAQKGVDLFLSTTAVESVGKIARAFKAVPLPQNDYDTVLFWVLQPKLFAAAVMKKLGIRPSLSRMGGFGASVVVRADRFVRQRRPKLQGSSFSVEEIAVSQIGDEFDALWQMKLKEQPRVLADRSSATLRWHFQFPGDKGAVQVFTCRKDRALVGYAIARHEPPNEMSLRRSVIADTLVKDDNPDVLRALWVAAYGGAERAGSHTFEMLGFPSGMRQVCSSWQPYVRKYPSCPFFYKAASPDLHHTLGNGAEWYASPYDGDTTLWGFGS